MQDITSMMSSTTNSEAKQQMPLSAKPKGTGGGHNPLSAADDPHNWPVRRKLHASLSGFLFAFAVAFGLTAYIPSMPLINAEYKVSMITSVWPYSLFLFGIAFAPIYTPHLSERVGRTPVYFASASLFAAFVLGSGLSMNFAALCVTRFLSGLAGGPCLVLIEGTFADVWSEEATGQYYSWLSLAAYVGTGAGPVVNGFAVSMGWRWSHWTTLIVMAIALAVGVGMPETYARQVARNIARENGREIRLPPAQSGVTLSEMAKTTIIDPLKQLATEPIVILSSLYLGLNFAVVFQFFITVPAVLGGVYSLPGYKIGSAFSSAILGATLAFFTGYLVDKLVYCPRHRRGNAHLEWRLVPAMIGSPMLPAALFWIGYTADPKFSPLSPIFGTVLYVWGNMSVLIGIIPYLFYAYPAAGTLSALTAAASLRIALAGFLPLVILQMFTNLTGKVSLIILASISILFGFFPWIMFFLGAKWRQTSKYNMMMVPADFNPAHSREHSMEDMLPMPGDEGDMPTMSMSGQGTTAYDPAPSAMNV